MIQGNFRPELTKRLPFASRLVNLGHHGDAPFQRARTVELEYCTERGMES